MYLKHSTKIVFIDDDPNQLTVLKEIFDNKYENCEYFSDLKSIGRFIGSYKFKDEIVSGKSFTEIVHKLNDVARSAEKYNQLSVVIIDYKLSEKTNGLDVLRKLKSKSVFRILNTGVADETIAIKAFNLKEIDGFYKKLTDIKILMDLIENGINSYFEKRMAEIKSFIEEVGAPEDVFLHHFDRIIKKHKIEEQYLIDDKRSHLLIDKDRAIYSFLVMPLKSVPDQIDILEGRGLPGVANQVLGRTKMLYNNRCFSHVRGMEDLIFPCKVILGREPYMYNLVRGDVLGLLSC